MIGSALSRISMADKLSIPQLQQAIENGTIPAYVGVPLLQEKVNQSKQAQALAAAPAGQPPIAQQIMQEAQGLTAARSNLPEFSAFDGGIVAFAGGDLISDDDEEDDEDRADQAYASTRNELLNELIAGYRGGDTDMSLMGSPAAASPMAPAQGRGIAATTAPSAPVSEGIAAVAPAEGVTVSSAKETQSAGLRVPSGHRYEREIIREAERLGISPELATKLAMMESGGERNPDTATSRAGARGVMQLMPGTAREMGVTDITDPEQNIRAGLGYFKRMMDKYGDTKLAGAAYNWGPGNVDRWLKAGADPDKLPAETRKYIASLKEGGAIRFQNEGLVDPMFGQGTPFENVMPRSELVEDPDMTLAELQEYNRTGLIPERFRSKVGDRSIGGVPMFGKLPIAAPESPRFATPPLSKEADAASRALQDQYAAQDIQEGLLGRELVPPARLTPAPEGGAGEGAKSAEPSFADYLKRYEDRLEKRREENKYMSILAAGLGMMGGTSPFAAANIGAGGMKGIETAAALNKELGLQERGLLRGQVEQSRALEAAGVRKELRNMEIKRQYTAQISRDYDAAVKSALARRKVNALEELTNPSDQQEVLREAQMSLIKNPGFQEAYKQVYGKEFVPPEYRVVGVQKKGS